MGQLLAAAALSRLGIRIPDEVRRQLRYGRGLDNRKLKAAGYRFGSRRARRCQARRGAARAPLRASGAAPYRYEREVEEFLRWSPSVRRKGTVNADRCRGSLGPRGRLPSPDPMRTV